jgi:hypothetical protein
VLDLSGENHTGVFIPPGVAHGFAALTDMPCITYLVDGYYNPADELGVAWDDPTSSRLGGSPTRSCPSATSTNPRAPTCPPVVGRTGRCAPDEDLTMKLFVTGGAGFIGSNYVRHVLATTDDEVTVFDAHLRRQPREPARRARRPRCRSSRATSATRTRC